MLLKRHYNWNAPRDDWTDRPSLCPECQGTGAVLKDDGPGLCPICNGRRQIVESIPPVESLEIKHTGTDRRQRFTVRFVTRGLQEGWLEMADDTIVLNTHPEALYYVIESHPGRYCCHCGQKLTDDMNGDLARLHVAQNHRGTPSPDARYPAGYYNSGTFECVLDENQHGQFSARSQ